jgi:hypothetical protein
MAPIKMVALHCCYRAAIPTAGVLQQLKGGIVVVMRPQDREALASGVNFGYTGRKALCQLSPVCALIRGGFAENSKTPPKLTNFKY